MIKRFMRKNGIALIAAVIISIVFIAGIIAGLTFGRADDPQPVEAKEQKTETAQKTESEVMQEPKTEALNLGEFKLYAYCPCESCSGNWGRQTSTGATATEGRTIAVDPSVIPYGSTVIINGAEYVAEDCGGAIKGKEIDIYFDSHDDAKKFGVQIGNVYLKIEG